MRNRLATFIIDTADRRNAVGRWLRDSRLGHRIYTAAERREAASQGQTPWW